MTAPRRSSYALAALMATVASALVLLPLLRVPWWESHDMVAYPVRLVEFAQALRSGQLWPRWAPDLYGGYGAPLFNFYPPGAVVPALPLYLVGVHANVALKFGLFAFTAIGLAAAYLSGELVTGRREAGLVALVVFATAPYRYTQLILRGDLAEYCATALAMLALFAYLAMRVRGPTLSRCLLAACAHASVMLTHTITGQWSTEVLGLLVAWWVLEALRAKDVRRAATYAVTFAGALGLMTIYVLPALAERGLVRIKDMATGHFATENNFVGSLSWLTSPGFFFVGWALLVAIPAALLAAVLVPEQRRRFLPWFLASLVIVALMCRVSAPVWHVLPFGRFIMFPWRLLSFLAITTSVLCAALWPIAFRASSWRSGLALSLVILGLGVRTYEEEAVPRAVRASYLPDRAARVATEIHSTVVFNEYLPLTVPNPPKKPVRDFVVATSDATGVESSTHSGTKVYATVDAAGPGWADLAQYDYPGWRLTTVDGPAEATLGRNSDGLVRVQLPVAGHYEVVLSWGTTPLRRVAAAITIATLLFLPLVLLGLLRRKEADAA